MSLTSPPLVSVRRHVYVGEIPAKISSRAKLCFPLAQFTLQQMCWNNLSVSVEAKDCISWRNERGKAHELWRLEFVILCNNRWLKMEVTARQKSVFPRCRKAYFHGGIEKRISAASCSTTVCFHFFNWPCACANAYARRATRHRRLLIGRWLGVTSIIKWWIVRMLGMIIAEEGSDQLAYIDL